MAKTNFKPFEFLTIVNTVLLITILVLSIYKVTQESFSNPPVVSIHEEQEEGPTYGNNYSPETIYKIAPKPNKNNIYLAGLTGKNINEVNELTPDNSAKTELKNKPNNNHGGLYNSPSNTHYLSRTVGKA